MEEPTNNQTAGAAIAAMRASTSTDTGAIPAAVIRAPRTRTTKAAPPAKKAAKAKARKVRDPNARRLHKIRGEVHDITHYVRSTTASGNGSLDSNDQTARELRGMEIGDVYATVSKALGVTQKELVAKYAHLNLGMQRMNLGNRLRAFRVREEAKAAGE